MRQPACGRAAEAGEAFWRFSLAFYARPGVSEALIQLQDRAGHDVNLILFALWAGAVQRVRLDSAALAAAEAAIADLRSGIVAPLRDVRRRLKGESAQDVQALRRKVLALELAAERRMQRRLVASLASKTGSQADRLAAAEANLALYLGAAAPEANLLRAALAGLIRR